MGIIKVPLIDYKNFENERIPFVGIYYLFKNSNFGLCKEFRIDIENCISFGAGIIIPRDSYVFFKERYLLRDLEEKKIQGIKTEVIEGISFKELSMLIARIHLEEFLKRHFWLRNSLKH